jgi:hypothetical protein
MTLANVPFSEADLAIHVLWMCPHQWQDQYNLQEKEMTPMDMHSLQASLEAIEGVCTLEKAHAQSGKKASYKNKAGAKRPVPKPQSKFPRKSVSRSPANYARSIGACILCTLTRTVAGTRKTKW